MNNYNKLISSCLLYKGCVNPREVQIAIDRLMVKYNIHFSDYNKSGFKYFISDYLPKHFLVDYFPYLSISVCRISNMPGINVIFNNLKESYNNYKGKDLIHPYISEGMEVQEFEEAVEELENLEVYYNDLESQIQGSEDEQSF